ncbi:MAG: aromatic amino acid hydroxylase [Phototrophicaceae bacterium]
MAQRPFYKFDEQADKLWATLYKKQYDECLKYAHPTWIEGLEKLNIDSRCVPDFEAMNEIFKAEVGWELVSTDVQYSDGQDWFENLAEKKFLITEYIRPAESLDYTPLPDIWHDTFGHLPWMINQEYADYVHEFALKSLQFTQENRHGFGSLWWYSIEFGLMRHNKDVKCFGAGLMSSYAEMQRAMDGTVTQQPFTLERMDNIDPSPHEYHTELFLFDDFEHLRQSTQGWYERHQDMRIEA